MTLEGPAEISKVYGGREYDITYPHNQSVYNITAQDGNNIWLPAEYPDAVFDTNGIAITREQLLGATPPELAAIAYTAQNPYAQGWRQHSAPRLGSEKSLDNMMQAYLTDMGTGITYDPNTSTPHNQAEALAAHIAPALGYEYSGTSVKELTNSLKLKVKASDVNASLPKLWHQTFSHPLRSLCDDGEERELQDLIGIGTFGAPQEVPKGTKRIGMMWVLLAKGDASGFFTKMKGRLTVMGNQ
jgi:hypothetical protein